RPPCLAERDRRRRSERGDGAMMLELAGPTALSAPRLAKRLRAIRAANPGVVDLDARHVHFVDLAAPLDPSAAATLNRLLHYGVAAPAVDSAGTFVGTPAGTRLLVVPRVGTISPWSSKATDIARTCGLDV